MLFQIKRLSIILVAAILGPDILFPAVNPDSVSAVTKDSYKNHPPFKLPPILKSASAPSKAFYTPQAAVLNSMEIAFSGGSSYGPEEGSGFLARFGIGLGGVAEMEFSTEQVVNELSGEETRFPSRLLKVCLVPERYAVLPYIPQIAVQLRTTSWGEVVNRETVLTAETLEDYARANSGSSINGIDLQSRFTTLHVAAGKDTELGGITLGASLTDVRTKEGGQSIWNSEYLYWDYVRIPQIQKNIMAPFGSVYLNANPNTKIIIEVSTIPTFQYNAPQRGVVIRKTWIGIAGIRFFMAPWFSLDGAVQYLSSYDGIADAEINLAVNMVLPLKTANRK
jgi:hypothetical protein